MIKRKKNRNPKLIFATGNVGKLTRPGATQNKESVVDKVLQENPRCYVSLGKLRITGKIVL